VGPISELFDLIWTISTIYDQQECGGRTRLIGKEGFSFIHPSHPHTYNFVFHNSLEKSKRVVDSVSLTEK